MRITERSKAVNEVLDWNDLEEGEVYMISTDGDGEYDGMYYIFTDKGSLVGLSNGDTYPSTYGKDAVVNRWKYKHVPEAELVVNTDEG